jgi:hypothetical protein
LGNQHEFGTASFGKATGADEIDRFCFGESTTGLLGIGNGIILGGSIRGRDKEEEKTTADPSLRLKGGYAQDDTAFFVGGRPECYPRSQTTGTWGT